MINIKTQEELDRPFNLLAWGHWFTFGNLLLALVFSFFYISVNPTPDTLLGWSYLLISWIGHFAFLCLATFILTIFPIVTLFPYKRHIRGVSAIMASIFQLLLFLDVLSFRGLGYHLSTSSLSQLREVEDVYVASLGQGYWYLLSFVFVVIVIYQLIISNYTWKHIAQLQTLRFKNTLARVLVSFFLLSHITHMFADATLHSDIAKQGNLFPLSYPLTAKTLLAEYELIDINEYKESKIQTLLFSPNNYSHKAVTPIQCDLNDAPNLNVVFVEDNNESNYLSVKTWLDKNNVNYQQNSLLMLSRNLDTAIFNTHTGLPGLYQALKTNSPLDINHVLNDTKISIEMLYGDVSLNSNYQNPSDSRVYVFFKKDIENAFYRAKVILIGFNQVTQKEVAIQLQNIVASYLNEQLNCSNYVTENLIDLPIKQLSSDSIATNFSDGYFSLVYKDSFLIFENGQLTEHKAFSNSREINSSVDLNILEQSIAELTSRRDKLPD